jgi:hypothetical protein
VIGVAGGYIFSKRLPGGQRDYNQEAITAVTGTAGAVIGGIYGYFGGGVLAVVSQKPGQVDRKKARRDGMVGGALTITSVAYPLMVDPVGGYYLYKLVRNL